MPRYKVHVLVSKIEFVTVEAYDEMAACEVAEDMIAKQVDHHEFAIEAVDSEEL